jgi:hypothetical protein
MTLKDLALTALKYGIPTALALLGATWLWVTFARIATGTIR